MHPKSHVWCFFLSFFWADFFAFLVPFFKRCIMLTKNRWYFKNKFCYFSIRICTRLEKFLRNGHKKYVQKSICRNLFVQIRRALGNLRNFLGAHVMTAYMVSWNIRPIFRRFLQAGAWCLFLSSAARWERVDARRAYIFYLRSWISCSCYCSCYCSWKDCWNPIPRKILP